jgi:branched-subunit amino acid transport protein AzlD
VTGRLLQEAGARVKVINLPGPDKGVDDFIAASGPLAYEKLSHLAPTFRDWQQQNQHSKTAAFQPLRKPIPEQRSIQLEGTGNRERATGNDKLDLLPTHREEEIEKTVACSPLPVPYLLQNKPQVQTHDFNQRQQPNSDTVPNREDRAIDQEFRAVTNQQPAIDPENRVLRNEPSREPNRNERESVELLAAINRDAELEKVFEHGDDIAGINQSSTDDGLRGQRTEKLSRQVNGQNSTIFNREASYVHSSQPATRQLLNTISDYVEQSAIESALTQTVLGLTEQLSQSHQQLVIAKSTFNDFETALTQELQSHAEKKAILSISDYIEQSAIESALTQTILGLTEQLSQSHQQLVASKTTFNDFDEAVTAELQSHAQNKAILSISDYIEQSAIESALNQAVLGLTEQLSQSHQQLVTAKSTFSDFEKALTQELKSHAEKGAILSISDYIEQSAIESALNQAVLGLTKQLSQSHQQLVTAKNTFSDFETALTQELQSHAEKKAILSISDYIEQSAVESALTQTILSLTEQLSRSHQQLVEAQTVFNDFDEAVTAELQSHAQNKAILSISDYVEQSAIESALNQAVLGLTEQLSQSHQQLLAAKSTFNEFETALTAELQSHAQNKAILSISDYVEQSAIESALTQAVLGLTEQLSQSHQQLVTAKSTFNDFDEAVTAELQPHAQNKAILSISDYIEQSTIESALTQAALGLTEQLSQSHQQLVTAKSTFNEFETALTAELQSHAEKRAILSISDYIEQSTIESALTQAVLGLTEQLSQSHQQLVTAKSTFNDFDEAVTAELQPHAQNKAVLSISDYIEQSAIESALTQTILGLTEQLSRSHQQLVEAQTVFNDFDEAVMAELQSHAQNKAILSISDYIEQSAIESALTQTILGLTEQLSQSHQQLLASKTIFNDFETALTQELKSHAQNKAILSISNYIEQSAIESALTQTVLGLTEQLSQSHQQLVAAKSTFSDFETALTQELQSHAQNKAILSISDYIEQSAIESALTQAVLGLTEQLSQSHQQLLASKTIFNDFETALTAELQSHVKKRAILSTSNSVEQSATESTLAKTLLAELKLNLKQMIQGLDIERLAALVMEVGKYVKGEKITGAEVSKLFTSVTTDALALTFEEKMNIVRQLIRDDKPSILKRLKINPQQSDDNGEQIRFRR